MIWHLAQTRVTKMPLWILGRKVTSESQLERPKTLGNNIVISFVRRFFRFVINSAHIRVSASAVLYVFHFSRQALFILKVSGFWHRVLVWIDAEVLEKHFSSFLFQKLRNPIQLDAWAIKTDSKSSICRDVDCLLGLMTRA